MDKFKWEFDKYLDALEREVYRDVLQDLLVVCVWLGCMMVSGVGASTGMMGRMASSLRLCWWWTEGTESWFSRSGVTPLEYLRILDLISIIVFQH